MNSAAKQITVLVVGLVLLAGGEAFGQQMYLSKMPTTSTPYSAPRVAQNPISGMQPGPLNTTAPAADNSVVPGEPVLTPMPAAPQAAPEGATLDLRSATNVPPGNPAPQDNPAPQNAPGRGYGAEFPGVMPPGQPVEGVPPPGAIENGLWPGCEADTGCAVCGGGYCTPPLWYTEQGVRILTRSRPRRVTLGQEFEQITSPVTGQPTVVAVDVFNTRSVNYDIAPGYEATIGRYLGRDSQDRDDFLEFSYWGMNTWVASNFINGTRFTPLVSGGAPPIGATGTIGNLNSPFPSDVIGFNRANTQTLNISSEMHDFELNLRLSPRGRPDQLILHPNGRWRHECQPGTYMSYLVGLRYMTIGDGAIWHASGRIENSNTGQNIFTSGDYTVQTQNDLLGLQIGTDLIFRRCKWSWGVHAKVGPYVNFARCLQEIQNQGAGDPFGFVLFNDRFNAFRQKVALIGEVGFEANYKFTPTLMGRVAYDFMWIPGLALAPEQFQFTDSPESTINTNGTIFSQGLKLGLEWTW